MNTRKGAAYEALVSQLAYTICQGTPLQAYMHRSGSPNRVPGASGFEHQIDLSLLGPDQLFLVELKCLNKPVGVEEVLVFASRYRGLIPTMPFTLSWSQRKRHRETFRRYRSTSEFS